LFM
jgi:hypothetical protein